MPSKQFAHLQEATLARLRALVPPDCPLTVARWPQGGFAVTRRGHLAPACDGRFQVVAAWIDGYVAAWRARPPTFLPVIQALADAEARDGAHVRPVPASAGAAPLADDEDWQWALHRVRNMQAVAQIGAERLGTKLLRGHGYPDEVMRDAQDARALLMVLNRLDAALSGSGPSLPAPAWQPIETAPKDATRILIWAESPSTGHRSVHVAWWAIPYESAPDDQGWWETGLYGTSHPVVPQFTHGWMPLPSPPASPPEAP